LAFQLLKNDDVNLNQPIDFVAPTFCVAVVRTRAHIIIRMKGTDKSLLRAD
jgi:hypothetical protein